MGFLTALISVILGVGLLVILSNSLTLVIRHVFRNLRENSIGEIIWYQIKPESLVSGRARRTPEEQASSVAGFMNGLQERWHLNRGTVSIVWHMGEDDLLRLYVGIDKSHHDSMLGGLNSLANGMNCRAEHCKLPKLPTKNPSFAFREIATPSNVLKEPPSLGSVARDLSQSGIQGAVIFTLEDMTPSESRRTEKYVVGAGATSESGFNHAGAHANIVGASAVRVAIAGVAANGKYQASESLLKRAYGSISTTAVKITAHSPYTRLSLHSASAAGLYSLLIGLFMFMGLPLTIGIPFISVSILTTIASAANLPLLGRHWVEARLAKGEVVLPPYRMVNTRWIRNRMTEVAGFGNYLAASRKQVIPMYSSPMAQVLSFPDGDATLSIAAEVVPQVGVPSSLDMTHRNDYILTGFTGEDQPIGIPFEDFEHCLYIAGAPNSGKSNQLEMMFGQLARLTQEQTGLEITSIWIETKGSGSYQAWDLAKANPNAIFVDAHNPSSNFRLALEGRRLSEGASVKEVLANVQSLVGGLQFAYGEQIAASSREALDFSIRISMLLTKDEIEYLELGREVDPAKPNVIRLAALIIREDGYYKAGPKLMQLREDLLKEGAKRELDERELWLSHSIGTLSDYFNERKDTTSKSAPPSNKLSALGNLETLWTPDHRQDVYVPQFPGHFAPIVLNMGPYISHRNQNGDPIYSTTNQSDAQKALLAFNHMLWKYSQARCSGWQEQNKRVILISDEMKDIAVDTDDADAENVVASVSKEGRSRGFSIWCASQQPIQVPQSVQGELLGFRSKFWYALPNKESARIAVSQMPRDTYFAEENVQKLPMGVAVVGELRQGLKVTAPFTMIAPLSKTWMQYYDNNGRSVREAAQQYSEHELDRAKARVMLSAPVSDMSL